MSALKNTKIGLTSKPGILDKVFLSVVDHLTLDVNQCFSENGCTKASTFLTCAVNLDNAKIDQLKEI